MSNIGPGEINPGMPKGPKRYVETAEGIAKHYRSQLTIPWEET